MRKICLIFALLISGTACGQWTEPDTTACPQPGPGTQAPWISNDNLRLYVSSPGQIAVFTRSHPDSAWGPLQIFSSHINATGTQRCPAESPSGDTLYWVGAARDDCENYGSWDVYYAIRTDTGWGPIFNAGANVNSNLREFSVGINRDGSMLLVASNRLGTYGADIYWHEKQTDGTWGPANHYGSEINDLSWSEEHPCLSPDNQRLFFYRDSPVLYDIWVSEKVNGQWQTAVRMPAPVNGPGSTMEQDPCLAMDGKTLWFRKSYNRDYDFHIAVSVDTSTTSVSPYSNQTIIRKPTLSILTDTSGGIQLSVFGMNLRGEHQIEIHDILGRLVTTRVIQFSLQNNQSVGALPDFMFPSGTYFFTIKLPHGTLNAQFVHIE